MVLRKCPSCREIVGGESTECPRCGVSFRAAMVRRAVLWLSALAIAGWAVGHYALRLV